MKIKYVLLIIFYSLLLTAGSLLCGFADSLRYKLYYDYTPTGIVIIILGFLGFICSFIEYIVDKIKDDKDK